MNIILLYLETVGISYVAERYIDNKIIKDSADHGYKINFNKLYEYDYDLLSITDDFPYFLIPLYNLCKVYEYFNLYNQKISTTVKKLYDIGILEEMSDFEKKEYQKKPNLLRAMFLDEIVAKKLTKCFIFRINDKLEENIIYYEFTKNQQDIVILKVEGSLKERLTPKELKEKVLKSLNEFIDDNDEEYCEDNEFYITEEKFLTKTPESEYQYQSTNNNQTLDNLDTFETKETDNNVKKLTRKRK